ncbi:MAG: preprotein translocase subunit SecG [Firmicutes bacterium]|nr:preprotein translocase subunit SecG [Bacillota bacterium]
MLHTILKYFEFVVSILLILAILVQNRSSGLSATFGGSGTIHVKKRGAEKVLFNTTIILAVLFVASSVLALFVR